MSMEKRNSYDTSSGAWHPKLQVLPYIMFAANYQRTGSESLVIRCLPHDEEAVFETRDLSCRNPSVVHATSKI